mmetsp:Transcript_3099/g.4782  ORF Transcript_3099/g.4782 Transcript_3099/m.4782 type:complete len:589 (+) Transcript_3099:15-1781(+)|eukprot:CAMPEP_0202435222 /NCGR_PEP_ID=MMETSP1345-20130828/18530_1 /ASSEMBLY_ACC=CAM_ASM_000843 /TAXON_ID=342563 /ORGANISM="Fabrea Fabrea salina" /LENGTH=588 /DNA_ID=CAMNT_0049048167 /DNA_START=747 /DNA_END=2513 /DNA_ORIENTATION=+
MFSSPNLPWNLFIGKDFESITDIKLQLNSAKSERFDYIRVPLFNQHKVLNPDLETKAPFVASDFALQSTEWNNCVQGKVTFRFDLESQEDTVRTKAEQFLKKQVDWAIYVGVHSIIIPCPSLKCSNLARVLNQYLEQGFYYQKLVIEVDVCEWENWNNLRLVLGPSTSLGVSLVVSQTEFPVELQNLWLGEPVLQVCVKDEAFTLNKHGFPVLTPENQEFFQNLFKQKVTVSISSEELEKHRDYIFYLFRKQPELSVIEEFSYEYWDYLQAPLQPLMQNLESYTYEAFEKDSVKYRLYEEAIAKALEDNPTYEVVMVIGAGRGPIVKAAIKAASALSRNIRLYALDKNPNAVATLENLRLSEWGDSVQVVHCDMRNWSPPEKAHIVVSELLGSFGDNELEPECLAGIERLLLENGISIPCKSTSYASPISSHKNWVNSVTSEKNPEQPYVCMLHNFYKLDRSLPVFSFEYPSNSSFERFKSLRFQVEQPVTLHGFVGYFESVLYKDLKLSTLPETHSEDMCSWFPMYFPIKKPVFAKRGEVELNIWRCNSSGKAWYEWELSVYYRENLTQTSGIQNVNGEQFWIGVNI